MRIDRKLNLVIPILDDEDKPAAYVHSMPIPNLAFEANYAVIAAAFSKVLAIGWRIAPRVAMLTIKDAAVEAGTWDGAGGVEANLVEEIKRATTVLAPASARGGWQTISYDEARRENVISPEDASIVENLLAFFTLASHMPGRKDSKAMLTEAAQIWGGQITSLSCTEFAASLPTLTPVASSGAKAA